MSTGTLYGVSAGPGDPELLTLKAVRVLRQSDVIAAPDVGHKRRAALSIVADHIAGKRVLDCSIPMVKDQQAVDAAYQDVAQRVACLLDEGLDVAYVTIGDASIYSTYYRIQALLAARGYRCEVVPGVPSFCAAAARVGEPLCEGPDRMMVVPVAHRNIDDALNVQANKVFMKVGSAIFSLRDKLAERGEADDARVVVDCGLETERVFASISDVPQDGTDYFSVVMVPASANPPHPAPEADPPR